MTVSEHTRQGRERELVKSWRSSSLVRAGYGVRAASRLAARDDVDLHLALELRARGCPEETALRILL